MEESRLKILRSSAGSGKTYRLAYEYIKMVVSDPCAYTHILAVTFTNKATEEMKSRILSRLNDLSSAKSGDKVDYLDALQRDCGLEFWQVKENARLAKSFILHDYGNFAVSTIDKFFQRIARSFFKELNLEFNYEVELSQDIFIGEAVERLLSRSKDDALLESLLDVVVKEQLEGNSWDIRARLCSMASVLTKEGYHRPVMPAKDLLGMLTKASDDLRLKRVEIIELARECCSAIEGAGLCGTDFFQSAKSFACQLEKMVNGEINGYNSYFTKAVESSDNWSSKTSKKRSLIESLQGVLTPLLPKVQEAADGYLWLRNGFEAIQKNFSVFLLLDYLAEQLDGLWRENNKLPIFRTTDLIAEITSSSDTPFIYEKLGSKYSSYMIDEFQDTSQKQWTGFKPLLEEALSSSDSERVMLIGDVKQAIYRWRGGDWRILAEGVANDFSGRVNDSESLTTNWRSLRNVIEFNNALFAQILEAQREALQDHKRYAPLISSAYNEYLQGVNSKGGGYVEVTITDDAEATLSRTLQTLTTTQGYSQRDIAILTRTRSQSTSIANLLVNKGYSVISDEALLINNSEVVRFIVALLKLSVNGDDLLSSMQVNMYLSSSMETHLQMREREILDRLQMSNPIKAYDIIVSEYGLGGKEVAYLQAFYEQMYRFCIRVSGDIGQFCAWWDDHKDSVSLAVPQGQEAITIITIHKSKGLQYPIVLLPYADWSLTPKANSELWAQATDFIDSDGNLRYDCGDLKDMGTMLLNFNKNLEHSPFKDSYSKELIFSHIDNLNLLYVALTRAERELHITVNSACTKNSVGRLIMDALPKMDGVKTQPECDFYSYGEKSAPEKSNETLDTPMIITNLEPHSLNLRVATRLPHSRLEDEDLSSRDSGILMHKLFSRVERGSDFEAQIGVMELEGLISPGKAIELKKSVGNWMQNDTIKGWFNDNWTVFSERAILSKGSSARRPDRVLISGDRAIVIDYKFGDLKREIHKEQVLDYGELLKGMGYKNVQCYLWYVTKDEILTL